MITQALRDELSNILQDGDYRVALDILRGQQIPCNLSALSHFITGNRPYHLRGQDFFNALAEAVRRRRAKEQAANQTARETLRELTAAPA